MIRRLDGGHDNIIGYELAGDLSEDDVQQVISEVRDVIARYEKVRVLFRLAEFSFQSFFTALDQRLRFLAEHRDDIERVAVISDEQPVEWASRVADTLTPVDYRHFGASCAHEAWAWLE